MLVFLLKLQSISLEYSDNIRLFYIYNNFKIYQ